jgi:sporulation protein YlmC with PRC-barrel domain
MRNKHLAYCLLGSALFVAPASLALAQQSPGAGAQAPAATAPQQPAPAQQPAPQAPPPGASMMQPLAAPSATHMMVSDLRGTRVYSAANEHIGDVNDIVLDRSGQVVAMVIGVGGFLGIGEKNVAVPFQALEMGAAAAATTGAGANAAGPHKVDRIVLRNMSKQQLEQAPSFKTSR